MKTKKEIFSNVLITNENAVYLNKSKTIIIADLHIGFEAEKQIHGISFPFFQKNVLIEKLNLIIEKYSPETIIVNGDFKHNFSKNLKQEWNEVIGILKFLKDKTNVILIKGNHDNFLKTIAKSQNVELVKSYFIEDFLLIHGDKNAKFPKNLILAHEHPSIKLRDELGIAVKLPCFLIHRKNRIIVLPSFSPLALGSEINKNKFLSPILKKLNNFEIIATSEIGLLQF